MENLIVKLIVNLFLNCLIITRKIILFIKFYLVVILHTYTISLIVETQTHYPIVIIIIINVIVIIILHVIFLQCTVRVNSDMMLQFIYVYCIFVGQSHYYFKQNCVFN